MPRTKAKLNASSLFLDSWVGFNTVNTVADISDMRISNRLMALVMSASLTRPLAVKFPMGKNLIDVTVICVTGLVVSYSWK
jgi:Flp pilus assembly protein protease CpaA